MAEAPVVRPVTDTGTLLEVVELFPSTPAPQHWALPFTIAQVKYAPAAMVVTPLVRPMTGTGTLLSFVLELFPSSP